jgi:type IV fimbrial biogenesis protein FimT
MNNYTHSAMYQHGITLLDLLATLSISAIVSATAFSGLSELKTTVSAMVDKSNLLTLVKSARQTAITNNTYTTICHLENNKCSDFSTPLTAFTDSNSNQMLDRNETVISKTKIDTNASLSWNRYARMRFGPNGRAGGFNGTLTYCHQTSPRAFSLVISRVGRIRVTKQNNCD